MIIFLNILIIFAIFVTFATLITGLIITARSDDDSKDNINKFMKYRVYFQTVAILIIVISLYVRDQIVG
ncbi:MAG: hypothetical protein CMP41_01575 [Rickettsiales bacterium]|jgi:uncharacterized membrane protein|nr:hypothetical protein [Rickettsiales bacterium]|tara:strand:+ start:48 stop:254 length:207 start_codon:yes stop_codon:yes gene_type:complete